MKKNAHFSLRLDDATKEAMVAAADDEGLTVGEFLRRLFAERRQRQGEEPRDPPRYHVQHVNALGPDLLWSGQEALVR